MAQATKSKKKHQTPDTKDIAYNKLTITCVCGSSFDAGSTLESMRVDICSKCHPFFTGEDRIVDAEGRVEKFKKKYEQFKK
ncbi:50S ribosomal protein L31 [bacterium]|jgi:large subunit ribosomal protein L31|nr:50S ribosomal protein L31 [bacterium]